MDNGHITFFDVTGTTLEVDSLAPYTTYEWRVAAKTSVGTGPFSTAVIEQTLQNGIYDKCKNHFMK